jgi:hypothetical protein
MKAGEQAANEKMSTISTRRELNSHSGYYGHIEKNLTEAEKKRIAEGRKERKEHPENFTAWTDVKREMGLV